MGEGSTDTPQGVGHGGGREASRLSPNHVPVLLKEAIDFLNVRRGGTYIDATVGLGGHSYEIAKRLGAPGHLIGLDKDPVALELAERTFAQAKLTGEDFPKVTLLQCSFAEVGERFGRQFADGLLADLGVSSLQLDDATRGFSFQADGPLDMRMDPRSERTAEQVVNHLDERELADVIYEFGEERRSRRIARAIVRSRPIRSTAHLADVISAAARPMNSESEANSSGDPYFSSSSNLRKPRTGRSEGAAESGAPGSEARRTRGGDQLSLAGGSHREGCLPRSGEAGFHELAYEKAAHGKRRRERSQSAGTQREIAGGGKSLAPENLPEFPAQL